MGRFADSHLMAFSGIRSGERLVLTHISLACRTASLNPFSRFRVMHQTRRRDVRCPSWPLLGGLLLLGLTPALADDAPEREQLSVLLRQLDMLDRQAERGMPLATQSRSRYHFDYARLREDLTRIRTGINDYLTPQRAQPRDPSEVTGSYRREHPEAP